MICSECGIDVDDVAVALHEKVHEVEKKWRERHPLRSVPDRPVSSQDAREKAED